MMELIGREHSGKTALKVCYLRGPLSGPQASGLELAAGDPRQMTRWMIDSLETYRDLTAHGLPSTLDPEVIPYQLFLADESRAVFQLREVVGQILTDTTPESDEQQQEQYNKYVDNLSRADVLQVVIPCPPSDKPEDLARFESDLLITAGYLREALKVRENANPVAVELVLTKIDAPFDSSDEARQALTPERLKQMLGRLVRIMEGSNKVGFGVIVPVSAFGFGTSVPAVEQPADLDRPAGGYSLLSQGERVDVLKPGTQPQPFNLTAAVWWALMAGLLLKPADSHGQHLADTARLMASDLEAMDAWFVPLKSDPRK